jgi:VWFA-related protein
MRASPSSRLQVSAAAALVAFASVLQGQSSAPPKQKPATETPAKPNQRTVIRRSFDLLTSDVIVRDRGGQFIPNLTKHEFELYEDGVKQEIVTFLLTHGGRVFNDIEPPPPPAEGIILPAARPTRDAAGRIFVIFLDDLHMDVRNTARLKDLLTKLSQELIHDGDMFSLVSTGPSSLAIDATYDRRRLDEAIRKISGAGLKPDDVLAAPLGGDGPPEVRYRAHVALDTAYQIMKNLEQVHNRRKAFVYISEGYDFNPFSDARTRQDSERAGRGGTSDTNPFLKRGTTFSHADLVAELSELTRAANRANATIYTIDPRGLSGGPDLDQKVNAVEWQDHVTTTQNSLRVLAEQTGGIAIVNRNNFADALKLIDGETSDYYVVGYYSNNPDPAKRRRKIEIKVKRPNVQLKYRTEYFLKPTKAPR